MSKRRIAFWVCWSAVLAGGCTSESHTTVASDTSGAAGKAESSTGRGGANAGGAIAAVGGAVGGATGGASLSSNSGGTAVATGGATGAAGATSSNGGSGALSGGALGTGGVTTTNPATGGTVAYGGNAGNGATSGASGAAMGGRANGGAAAGGAATGGTTTTGGTAVGGAAAGRAGTGGAATGGAATGGTTATGGTATGGAPTGGTTATGGAATGGAATGGTTATGGAATGGAATGGAGTTGPNCDGSNGDWDGCRGSGCWVCEEKLVGFPKYLTNHPNCTSNTSCNGGYYGCGADCPKPTDNDRADCGTRSGGWAMCANGSACNYCLAGFTEYFARHPGCTPNPTCSDGVETLLQCDSSCPDPTEADRTPGLDCSGASQSGSSPGWNGCQGSGCAVCVGLVSGYPKYFDNHPNCSRNWACTGNYECSSHCPAPTDADK